MATNPADHEVDDRLPPEKLEQLRKAAMAAALAAKSAGSAADLVAVAANVAFSQGASPGEAATIALELKKQADVAGGANSLSAESGLTAAVAAAATQVPQAVPAGTTSAEPASSAASSSSAAAPSSSPTTAARLTRLYRALLALPDTWSPDADFLASLAGDGSEVSADIDRMQVNGFVARQNGYIFVTESGRRYLEYLLQTLPAI